MPEHSHAMLVMACCPLANRGLVEVIVALHDGSLFHPQVTWIEGLLGPALSSVHVEAGVSNFPKTQYVVPSPVFTPLTFPCYHNSAFILGTFLIF